MVKRGFVVISVEYRRGTLHDVEPYTSVQHTLASYRASQDVRGAIRSIIKKQDVDGTGSVTTDYPYRIDTSKIFLAGISAGSLAVLRAALYPSQTMINDIFPKKSGSTYSINQVVGNMDMTYYYAPYNYDYIHHIKGILNLWGAVIVPADVTSEADAEEYFSELADNGINLPPIISFCGKLDNVAPINYANVYFSPDDATVHHGNFNLANATGTDPECVLHDYQLDINHTSPDAISGGSLAIYNYLQNQNIPSELYIDCQMGHGLDNGSGSNFKSDFGTGFTTAGDVYEYIAQRTASFFQSILGGIDFSGLNGKFIECVNSRHSCSEVDDYDSQNCCENCTDYSTGHLTDPCDAQIDD